MMAFLRNRWWWSRVKDTDGVTHQRSLKTQDKKTALAMEALLTTLRSGGDTQLVTAVAHGILTPLQVFNAHRTGKLSELRATLNDTDVRQFIERRNSETGKLETPWAAWARRSANATSVDRYTQQLRVLVPADHPVLLSTLTRRAISEKLAALDCSGSTAKRYHAAWSSFFTYLVEIGVTDTNPLRSIRAPKANPTREIWLELADVLRYIDAHAEPFQSLAALREGAGVEIGAALRTRVRDVGPDAATVYVRGSKTETRKRTARIDAFARPYLLRAVRNKLPDALLFPVWANQDSLSFREQHPAVQRAYVAHKAARKAAKIDPRYTMHDARHSYAVRHMMAGDRPELIAHNLGHTDASQVIKNYGKYRPNVDGLSHTFTTVEEASA